MVLIAEKRPPEAWPATQSEVSRDIKILDMCHNDSQPGAGITIRQWPPHTRLTVYWDKHGRAGVASVRCGRPGGNDLASNRVRKRGTPALTSLSSYTNTNSYGAHNYCLTTPQERLLVQVTQ